MSYVSPIPFNGYSGVGFPKSSISTVFRPNEFNAILWTKIRKVGVVVDISSTETVYDGTSPGVDFTQTTTVHFVGEANKWANEGGNRDDENNIYCIANALLGPMLGAPQIPQSFNWTAKGSGTRDYSDSNGGSSSTPITSASGIIYPVGVGDPGYEDTLGDMTRSKWAVYGATNLIGIPGDPPTTDWNNFDDGATIALSGSVTTEDPDYGTSTTTYSFTIVLSTT